MHSLQLQNQGKNFAISCRGAVFAYATIFVEYLPVQTCRIQRQITDTWGKADNQAKIWAGFIHNAGN
jgi:hypothetical protein